MHNIDISLDIQHFGKFFGLTLPMDSAVFYLEDMAMWDGFEPTSSMKREWVP